MARHSPLGAVGRGLVVGAAATAVMTGYQLLVQKARGQESGGKPRAWKDAPAPAQVAKRIVSGVFQRPVGLDQVDRLTNVMHWAYGTAWGVGYGLLQGTLERPVVPMGLGFGSGVWAMSYAQLVPLGIYAPPWESPPQELALDLSYHLVYGAAAAVAYELLP